MFYWGVDKVYPQLGTHNVFLAGDYQASFDAIFNDHTLPDEPSFYVHAPARVDPAAAPAGQDTLIVLVPVGHLDEAKLRTGMRCEQQARQATLDRLADLGVTDLEQHLKFEISYTPRTGSRCTTWRRARRSVSATTSGRWAICARRTGTRDYRNLYFAGASTHPGTGLPIVLLSAKLTTERIVKEQPLAQRHPASLPGKARNGRHKMNVATLSWEHKLLDWAHEGLEAQSPA